MAPVGRHRTSTVLYSVSHTYQLAEPNSTRTPPSPSTISQTAPVAGPARSAPVPVERQAAINLPPGAPRTPGGAE